MADHSITTQTHPHTPYRDGTTHVHTTSSSSGGTMAFAVGAIVVILGVIAWALLGGGDTTDTSAPVPAPAAESNVTIEAPAPVDGGAVETVPAPAEETAPAPAAEPATDDASTSGAPADDTATGSATAN